MARESGAYRCERCHKVTRVQTGALIPPCTNCGFAIFDLSNPRFETRSGELGPREPG